mmetsp:Transcript_41422/g.98181  ORF Transcript_41422/g.98181 Transcript_41422/m.98181 type:complete len:230 (-) Transcript_41422:28-717(-)
MLRRSRPRERRAHPLPPRSPLPARPARTWQSGRAASLLSLSIRPESSQIRHCPATPSRSCLAGTLGRSSRDGHPGSASPLSEAAPASSRGSPWRGGRGLDALPGRAAPAASPPSSFDQFDHSLDCSRAPSSAGSPSARGSVRRAKVVPRFGLDRRVGARSGRATRWFCALMVAATHEKCVRGEEHPPGGCLPATPPPKTSPPGGGSGRGGVRERRCTGCHPQARDSPCV